MKEREGGGDWTPSVEREKKERQRERESWCCRRTDCHTESVGSLPERAAAHRRADRGEKSGENP